MQAQPPFVSGLDNNETYQVRTPKPIQQTLDEKFFLWLSPDAELREHFERLMLGETIEITTAVEAVEEHVDDLMCDMNAMHREFCQIAQDYTDWTHLTRRLCENFGIAVDNSFYEGSNQK